MVFIIGLGNPGKKFENTWHNLGRLTVTSLRKDINLPEFKFSKKFNAFISRGIFEKKNIMLVLPETFINRSGKTVRVLLNYYKPRVSNFWVVHDDIDLILGKIKIVKNRGSAGHKGVESIIKELKSKNFVRFRIGIGIMKNEQKTTQSRQQIEKFVLKKFSKKEEKILEKVIERAIEIIEFSLKEGIEKAMSFYNH